MRCENCGLPIDKYLMGMNQWMLSGDGVTTLCRFCSPTFTVIITKEQ